MKKEERIEGLESFFDQMERTQPATSASEEKPVRYEFSNDELMSEPVTKVTPISLNRPVMPPDLDRLREELGYTVHQICALLGIHTPSRWYTIVTGSKKEFPVDPAIAKSAIWYSRHPDRAPLFGFNMHQLYEHPRLRRNIEWLGSLFGRTKIAANKWLREDAKQEPYVLAMAAELKRLLDELDMAESRCRGGDNSRTAHLNRARAIVRLNEFIDMAQEYQLLHGREIAKARRGDTSKGDKGGEGSESAGEPTPEADDAE